MMTLGYDDYMSRIDSVLLHAIHCGNITFDRMLVSLPGVYPSIILSSLRRLASKKLITEELMSSVKAELNQALEKPVTDHRHHIKLPVPHPLDYDWRFHDSAIQLLLERCPEQTTPQEKVILLGTPSILRFVLETGYSREMLLFDANYAVVESLANVAPSSVIHCDLSKDTLLEITSPMVILDPPWYPESIQLFLWAASRFCSVGGDILVSLPPLGTRPTIEQEREKIFAWAEHLGLTLIRLEQAALPYISPLFEQNALRAEGICNTPKRWRRGDLATFQQVKHVAVNRPIVSSHGYEWTESILSGIRIRVRYSRDQNFRNPMLESVVSGDVLPSVSRRDARRDLVDVWTSGNRVFMCEGKNILQHLIQALATDVSPYSAISCFLKRELNDRETEQISFALQQISELVALERNEILLYGEDV